MAASAWPLRPTLLCATKSSRRDALSTCKHPHPLTPYNHPSRLLAGQGACHMPYPLPGPYTRGLAPVMDR